jgi:hypothetical protein
LDSGVVHLPTALGSESGAEPLENVKIEEAHAAQGARPEAFTEPVPCQNPVRIENVDIMGMGLARISHR